MFGGERLDFDVTVANRAPRAIAAATIAELCANTVREHADAAVASVRAGRIDEAVERVVEANTLLSGVGFESGGLATTHAVASGLTFVPQAHHDSLHGELVTIGVLTQLVLEDDLDEVDAGHSCTHLYPTIPLEISDLVNGYNASQDRVV